MNGGSLKRRMACGEQEIAGITGQPFLSKSFFREKSLPAPLIPEKSRRFQATVRRD